MEKTYYVYSIYVTAYFLTRGLEIVEVGEKENKVVFYFNDTPELRTALKEYRSNVFFDEWVKNINLVRGKVLEIVDKKREVTAK